jgi:3-hydroxymyristoyl/3-hydroxydecanoyl-(acyl carrier protein) dehydratase
MWHFLGQIESSDAGEIRTEVQVPPESQWFSGHFPGEPILPGIAQLGIVYEALCRARGGRLGLTGFSRVKFKKIIRPCDRLEVSVVPVTGKEGAYAFRIVSGDDLACSGTMRLGA